VHWCDRCGWELRRLPDTGPVAATAAARFDARVLALRPCDRRPGARRQVVAAVCDLPADGPVVADAAACAARMGAALLLVHAVPRSFAERSVDLPGAVAHGRRLLEAAAAAAAAREPDIVVTTQLWRMRPYELVGEALDADLLVVGGPRTDPGGSPRPGAGPGLVASSALHHAPCPVLLTPRSG
jgi:nucleotide-binding universal stress UspA family protein